MEKSESGTTMASKREAAAKAEMAFKVKWTSLNLIVRYNKFFHVIELSLANYSPIQKSYTNNSNNNNLVHYRLRQYWWTTKTLYKSPAV